MAIKISNEKEEKSMKGLWWLKAVKEVQHWQHLQTFWREKRGSLLADLAKSCENILLATNYHANANFRTSLSLSMLFLHKGAELLTKTCFSLKMSMVTCCRQKLLFFLIIQLFLHARSRYDCHSIFSTMFVQLKEFVYQGFLHILLN